MIWTPGTTRSGATFRSLFVRANIAPIETTVDFGPLLADAIEREIDDALAEDVSDEVVDDIHVMPEASASPTSSLKRSASPDPAVPAGKNAHRHKKRKEKRNAKIHASGHYPNPAAATKILENTEPVATTLRTEQLPAALGAYSAVNIKPASAEKAYSPEELDRLGLTCVKYEPKKIRPVLDSKKRVIAIFADKPDDKTYDESCSDTFTAMRNESDAAGFKTKKHRRGRHAAINVGITTGNGLPKPARLQLGSLTLLVNRLVGRQSVIRMATYQSAAFNLWAPRVHLHYREHMGNIYAELPDLRPNFPKSVFPTFCFNLGRHVTTFKHRDILNCPYGWCAITALGRFDYTKGGHIILWELKLYFEFSHGCTILIPSATITHSNVRLADPANEERLSFTQYLPGALLRWVDNGFRTDLEVRDQNKQEYEDLKEYKKTCWEMGLGLLSKLDDILDSLDNFVLDSYDN